MRARVPLTFVYSHEEERVERAFLQAANVLGRTAHVWSLTKGFVPDIPETIPSRLNPPLEAAVRILENKLQKVILLKDYQTHLSETNITRVWRDFVTQVISGSSIFLLGPELKVPIVLLRSAHYFEFPIQSEAEIETQIRRIRSHLDPSLPAKNMTDEDVAWAAKAAFGMTEAEINNACAISLVTQKSIDADFIANFRAELAARKVIASEDAMPEGS